MAKLNQATIRLVLGTNRPRKDGTCPVFIRVQWNGRKEKATGIYVLPKHWDAKNETIKYSQSADNQAVNYAQANQLLLDLKSKVLTKRNLLEAKGIEYTCADLLSDEAVADAGLPFDVLLEQMIRSKGLSQNTAQAYRAAHRRMKTFLGAFTLSQLDEAVLRRLCKDMKKDGFSDSSINTTMAMVKSVFSFLAASGTEAVNPFTRFRYWKTYRIQERHITLSQSEIRVLVNHFVSSSVIADGLKGEWRYTDDGYRDLMNRNSELFALGCFLLCYYMQGLAFCDLVRIRRENISVVEYGRKEYYRLTGMKRKKTGKPIEAMMILKDSDTCVLFECYIRTMGLRDGYFLPVLQNNSMDYGYGDDEKKITETTGTCSHYVNTGLRNVMRKLGIKDWDKMSYYVARHSYATNFILNGGNPIRLATMMGRSMAGIFRYVSGLTSTDQNIRERTRVFGD